MDILDVRIINFDHILISVTDVIGARILPNIDGIALAVLQLFKLCELTEK